MTRLTMSLAMWTFNGARYLPEQLASLSCQRRLPDELVVSDDASTDATVELVRAYAKHAPFPVRLVVNRVNIGPSRNHAQAVNLCAGEIIVPLGQDDVQHPDKLARIEAVFAERPAVGLCFSDAALIDERSHPLGESLWQRIRFSAQEQRIVAAGALMAVLIRHNVVSGPTCAYRACYRDAVLPIPDGWWEDYWTALIVGALSPVALLPACLVKYRLHPGQQLGLPSIPYLYNLVYARWMTEFWSAAREPIIRHLPPGYQEAVLTYVDNMIEHCQRRAALPRERLRRLPTIARELLNRRYARFSYGWGSALSDLTYPSHALGLVRRLLLDNTPLRPLGRILYGTGD